jgi:hypothetical protein
VKRQRQLRPLCRHSSSGSAWILFAHAAKVRNEQHCGHEDVIRNGAELDAIKAHLLVPRRANCGLT